MPTKKEIKTRMIIEQKLNPIAQKILDDKGIYRKMFLEWGKDNHISDIGFWAYFTDRGKELGSKFFNDLLNGKIELWDDSEFNFTDLMADASRYQTIKEVLSLID